MTDTTHSSRLMAATLNLLRQLPRDRSLADVAEACRLSPAWVSAFLRGDIPSPSVHKVECLWEHLTGKSLDV